MTERADGIGPGDVLLFGGDGWIARAIQWFDGAPVSHAAIALDDFTFAEVTGHGIDCGAIDAAIESRRLTIALRHGDVADAQSVVDAARALSCDTARYVYHPLVLLALVATTRRIPRAGRARRLVRSALERASDALEAWARPHGPRRFMLCSEFAARCYAGAGADGSPGFDLGLTAAPPPAGARDRAPTYLDWALARPQRVAEAAAELAAAASEAVVAGIDLVAAEAEVAELVVDYALVAGRSDPRIAADIAQTSAVPAPEALAKSPSPSDVELLAAHVRFARALQGARADPRPVGAAAAAGGGLTRRLLCGLDDLARRPDLATPGALASRARALAPVGALVRS
jgi:hypothetical protein